MSSFLQTIDIGLRASLFSKFEDLLDLVSINRGVVFYPKEVAFRMIAEKKGTAISEFINVWRVSIAPSMERQRTPVARRGMVMKYVDDTDLVASTVVKAMPVDLEYNVWFWTKNIENINLIAERYLFWQQDNPNLSLYYNTIYPVEFDLHFGELVDESNVPSMLDKGNHFCMRVPIKMDGWVFVGDNDSKIIQKIELELYDSQNLTNYKECIFESDDYDGDVEAALRLYEEHIFGILGVSVSAKTFTVNRTSASEFVANAYIYVDDSTGNDGRYTIVSAVDGVDNTVVTVLEDISDSTVDGTVSLKNVS